MAVDLIKLAGVLEAAATYLDTIESDKLAAITNERQSVIDKLASKYVEATGEDLPDNIRGKLASSDSEIVGLVQSMIDKQASQAAESLGAPSDRSFSKQASADPDERFLNWVQS